MERFLSTYRLQLHKEFRLQDLSKILVYLEKLGISTIYSSPLFKAVPGSQHGYDILDPNSINPEIGTMEELEELIAETRSHGFSWLQDIVPNHMAYFPENPWIMDVLEKGPRSLYANYFDISWSNETFQGRLMLPFLGKSLSEVLSAEEITLAYTGKRLCIVYYNAQYPVQPRTYAQLLQGCEEKTSSITQFLEQLNDLHHMEDQQIFHNAWKEMLVQFESLMNNEKSAFFIQQELKKINQSPEDLDKINEEQYYRLCHWQEADGKINYRRFFTVNSLICLNIQDEKLMDTHHELIFQLVKKGLVQGLRVDHIDGLADPAKYLQRLRQKTGTAYITVEKILEHGESLPKGWPVQGTTGYDFLSLVNNLLTLKSSEESFTRFYNGIVGDHRSIPQQIRDKKAMILYHHMGGELENLFQLLLNSGLVNERQFADMRTEDIKTVIAEFLIHCPVYRYYGNQFPLEKEEAEAIQNILLQVKSSRSDLEKAADLLQYIFVGNNEFDDNKKAALLNFYQRCMQFSGPLMAKGVEDTLMYTYNRFLVHNEVGDAPGLFGISPKEFHHAMVERQKNWPLSLNATSTHDTKRGEDVRARLNVISQIPQEWKALAESWFEMNKRHKTSGMPDGNDEYFIYQTIIGAWPQEEFEIELFENRLREYFIKAFREAKRYSSWTQPNEAYEKAVISFVAAILDDRDEFYSSAKSFVEKINDHGIINSLNQLVLKTTCPGIPDFYQGCELWDLSLVDPDNRRVVNFELRKAFLADTLSLQDKNILDQLWIQKEDGRIKLWFTQKLLEIRSLHPDLFQQGEYLPMKAEGKFKDHIFSFARKFRNDIIVIAIPLHSAQLIKKQQKEIRDIDWEDTRLVLPSENDGEWHNILDNFSFREKEVVHINTCSTLPYLILKGKLQENERGAGILMHISSLPSAFGIGDMGPEAYAFADQLLSAGQRYWQILPLNPVEEGQGYSPYSSTSSFAGNRLFISPEILVQHGLLDFDEVNFLKQGNSSKTDFVAATETRDRLIRKAYFNFKNGGFADLKTGFKRFCEIENPWLEDFTLYTLLKDLHGGKPWYEWPEKFRQREPGSLSSIKQDNQEALELISFTQFIFHEQWQSLKSYCNSRGMQIMGDLPFYISYDSADVWSHRELFKVDEAGKILMMAGVPPDAFSAEGQLWGMPVYRWEVHKEKNYDWWKKRLAKNNELFDLLRLDHFRAFEAYWEVEAGEANAVNGKWIKGPGVDFFNSIKKQLESLPFIAEDLGEITPEVYSLRDRFKFPGMKVLQFAFGENFNRSDHIPHSYEKKYIVYTGTHDNNTLVGWLNTEAGEDMKSRIRQYIGYNVPENEIPGTLCRLAFASVAKTVILPLQDVLELDETTRMNTPAQARDNWTWRVMPGQIKKGHLEKLMEWTWLYQRG